VRLAGPHAPTTACRAATGTSTRRSKALATCVFSAEWVSSSSAAAAKSALPASTRFSQARLAATPRHPCARGTRAPRAAPCILSRRRRRPTVCPALLAASQASTTCPSVTCARLASPRRAREQSPAIQCPTRKPAAPPASSSRCSPGQPALPPPTRTASSARGASSAQCRTPRSAPRAPAVRSSHTRARRRAWAVWTPRRRRLPARQARTLTCSRAPGLTRQSGSATTARAASSPPRRVRGRARSAHTASTLKLQGRRAAARAPRGSSACSSSSATATQTPLRRQRQHPRPRAGRDFTATATTIACAAPWMFATGNLATCSQAAAAVRTRRAPVRASSVGLSSRIRSTRATGALTTTAIRVHGNVCPVTS